VREETGPVPAAYRSSLIVDHGTHHDLIEIQTEILSVTAFADLSLERDGRGIEEDDPQR